MLRDMPDGSFIVYVWVRVGEEDGSREDQGCRNGDLHYAHHGVRVPDHLLRGHRNCHRYSIGTCVELASFTCNLTPCVACGSGTHPIHVIEIMNAE